MRPIETLRAGNWLFDTLHDRYITIVCIGEPMIVQSVHKEYRLLQEYITHIRINTCPITELGFISGANGYERTAGSIITYLQKIENGFSLIHGQAATECIWLVDQLQNYYEDITGEKLLISLIGSKSHNN